MKTHKPLRQRFVEKIGNRGDGCWIWTARIDPNGYGRFNRGPGVSPMAHRAAYEFFVGPIPEGMTLDHRCHTDDETCSGGVTCPHRRCVNPAHLEVVTVGENTLRGRSFSATNAIKTHCSNDHELSGDNVRTVERKDGRTERVCVTCARARKRAYKQRLKEAA